MTRIPYHARNAYHATVAMLMTLASAAAVAASFAYDSFLPDVAADTVNLSTATVKCALVTGYTPNQAAHTRWSDVQSYEISGTGYTAGGNVVAVTRNNDTVNHRLTITIAQTTWPASTLSAQRAVCYVDAGTAAASPLIFQNDFGGTVSSTAATFTLGQSIIYINTPQ